MLNNNDNKTSDKVSRRQFIKKFSYSIAGAKIASDNISLF